MVEMKRVYSGMSVQILRMNVVIIAADIRAPDKVPFLTEKVLAFFLFLYENMLRYSLELS